MNTTALTEQKAPTFSLVPQTFEQAIELAKLIAESDLAPKDYQRKPGNVLIAVQMGQEVGLGPIAAVQNIAVINGKPSIYGDAGKALLLARGFQIEEDDAKVIKVTGMGRCKITRPGHAPCERTFSIENATTAGLWDKPGPWKQYPYRQLAWRAFWFAARDCAADVLKGIGGAEEVLDYTERDVTPPFDGGTDARQADATENYWSQSDFEKNLPQYTKVIEKGTRTAEDVITVGSSKHKFTDKQLATIRAIKAPIDAGDATPAQHEEILAAASAASISTEDIRKKFGLGDQQMYPAAMVPAILAFIKNPMEA